MRRELVFPTGTTPKEKVSTKSKHWTLLGITMFDGSTVICVVIFTGKQKVPLYETSMDPFDDIEGTPVEAEFFDNNSGPGKLYPGRSKCTYKGNKVPCMCCWTPKYSINSTILTDILRNLDNLGCYKEDQQQRFKPMFLLDAHGSRMELKFLSYINSVGTEWVVCIGVPYGTGLW